VRFVCGTQELHQRLEKTIAGFLGTEDTILYSSCFDANGGVFEALLTDQDVIISDELNHASIIDGIRLCRAERLRYPNGDLEHLETLLHETQHKRLRMIATDGVFSMDGTVARLDAICDLADKYGAMVMVDDSHATGVLGARGRGTPEHYGVGDRVDIITGTLGKALGGAAGGFVSGRGPLIQLLRQRSRPYLFSNSLPPVIAATSMAILELLETTSGLRERLMIHASRFRRAMAEHGFRVPQGIHPIVPVMIGDAKLAVEMAARMYSEGIYVVGFAYPVVPQGKARIRVQLSAAHTHEHVEACVETFARVGREMGAIGAG
jgi:glycine C-acetyltransferase